MSEIALRSPDVVMRLERLGAAHSTRLSFLRTLIRRATNEGWVVTRALWLMDEEGFGRAVYRVGTQRRTYSLVAFSTPLEDARRTDRVIAEAWDTSYVLYDGEPASSEVDRLAANAPLQEAGRYGARDLVLARANKSVRLFSAVVDALARGAQPDERLLAGVGYLMRTTAVYGNGKFGIADRDEFLERPELAGPYQAEMLTVWLIRSFTMDLTDHVAERRAPGHAAKLDRTLRRRLGVGNATGLGMAPYLVRHPLLMHNWFHARETALTRVRSLSEARVVERATFACALDEMRARIAEWRTGDARQSAAISALREDLARLAEAAPRTLATQSRPWDALYRFAEANLSVEGQEAAVALLLEPHGAVIDDLADGMAADESLGFTLDGRKTCGQMRALIAADYAWAWRYDFAQASANARFWYVSAEKLEPRLGERFEEAGQEFELPLAVARDIQRFDAALADPATSTKLADFLLRQPEWRQIARRAQLVARYPYGEIRENLLDAKMRPVDLLRAKLAFFGAHNFDPRSDRWLRIALFAGEPLIEEVARADFVGWAA